jgi:hypothetical protein
MSQRSRVITGLCAVSLMVGTLLSLPKTQAATQIREYGPMGVCTIQPQPNNVAYCAVNQPTAIPAGLIEVGEGVSRSFLQEIDRGLGKIPVNVLRALTRSGYRVAISESLTDVVPQAKNQQVRGYEAHSTWDEVYGMYNRTTKRVVMAEKAMQPDPVGRTSMVPLRDVQRREGILRHEFGHAVDEYLGNYSHSAEFKAAYAKGLKTISQHERKVLSYYLQPGDAGREETFAEIFAALNEAACDRNSDILLKNHFPELVQLIRAKVAKISA